MNPQANEFRRRYKYLALFALAAFAVILGRIFFLQVVHTREYADIAHGNIVRKIPLPTTRGIVRDARGRILASSRPAYDIYIVPGSVTPTDRRAGLKAQAPDSLPRIADALRMNPEERARIAAKVAQLCSGDDEHSPCFRPLLLREDVSRDIVAEIRQHASDFGGVQVTSRSIRYYPYKNLGSHLLGYMSEIDAARLAEERMADHALDYEPGDMVGATGIERAWEKHLRGEKGWEKRVVDARGRYRSGPDAERYLDAPVRQDPIPGQNLQLTIDMDVEAAVEKAMRAQRAGAVVVADVHTGRLLAVYSKPEFDSNDLSGGSGRARVREAFAKLVSDPLTPMLDKTMSGAFQPGSTFKPFSALAALEDGTLNPEDSERCDGSMSFGRRIFHCTHVHGKVNMREAIAESCNIYFFKLAESVGMDRIAKTASEFGLGEKTGLETSPEAAGRVPHRSWYSMRYHGQFRLGFTLNTAIGQGATTVTPLQLALAYAALGNGGTLYAPQVVRSIEASDGAVVEEYPPRARRQIKTKPESLALVNAALWDVVNAPKGTAYPVRPSREESLDIAGKTGTAQTGYVARDEDDAKTAWYNARDHAWFAALFPAHAPEIAVVVLIEHGGSGPTQAAPVAMQIIRDYNRQAKP